MYERLLAIREKAVGPDHPEVAAKLNNLAVLLKNQVRVESVEVCSVRQSRGRPVYSRFDLCHT